MFSIDLTKKVAWVTGASRGIGKAIALSLAKAGCDVAVSYKGNEALAASVCKEIVGLGRRSLAVRVDVASAADCENAFAQISSALGAPDILVNSAGVIADHLFLMLGEEEWQSVLQTNIMGTVHTSKLVIKDMMGKRWGRIINLSSVAATRGGRGQSNYAASKGAIEAMTRSLASEIGRRGITVNCIAPGVIETDMTQEVIKLAKDEIMDRLIIKRFGNTEEVAAWAVMLASEYGAYMTGQVIHVDGGLKMA